MLKLDNYLTERRFPSEVSLLNCAMDGNWAVDEGRIKSGFSSAILVTLYSFIFLKVLRSLPSRDCASYATVAHDNHVKHGQLH